MNLQKRKIKRAKAIVEIADEAKGVLPDPYDHEIVELVVDCTGFSLTERERRLAIVAYETDAETARSCIYWP